MADGLLVVIWIVATGMKLLMMPAYRSTDFEVHRNWLAITHSRPLREWYTEDTSVWTLDYPPIFAWFEFALSKVARFFDQEMLKVENLEYASAATIFFQRLTVIVFDTLLLLSVIFYCNSETSASLRTTSPYKRAILAAVVCFNAGLIIVDNIHFQYNGLLLSLLIFSISLLKRNHNIAGAVVFAALLNMKHIFMYMAPVYFVYLLRKYCFVPSKQDGINRFHVGRFLRLASAVAVIFLLSFGPFIYLGQFSQVLSRLFPFKRGLTHSYWAPNTWALYNTADKMLLMGCRALKLCTNVATPSFTGGLVQDDAHALLPSIRPVTTMVLTLFTMLPVLVQVWRHPSPRVLVSSVSFASMCSFMLGWHVHEKAILMVSIPLSLLCMDGLLEARLSFLLNTIGSFSLFPLLFRPAETSLKILLLLLHTSLTLVCLGQHLNSSSTDSKLDTSSGRFSLQWWHKCYLWGTVFVQLYYSIGHSLLFGGRLPFLPLMIFSVYCSLGMHYIWFLCWRLFQRQIAAAKSLETDDKKAA
eukprot:GILJ01008689.1.p1 GENE.GILJ01008689.1~~GILJ01008689.1.p1  ORF type:complete len:542 (-),score=48.76 GILJ01008689.1:56-1639(-)